jgi:hypothetical protein
VLATRCSTLPFRYSSTFVIEERFGFNRSTRATVLADLAEGHRARRAPAAAAASPR